jgi:hypothetical protein
MKAKFIVTKCAFFDACVQYLLLINKAGFGRGRRDHFISRPVMRDADILDVTVIITALRVSLV